MTTREPEIVEKPAMRIAGFGRVLTWSNMREIPRIWDQAGPWIESILGGNDQDAYGAMFVPEPGAGDLGYLAGMVVQEDYELAPGQIELRIPAIRWAVFPHNGALADFPATIDAAQHGWLPTSGFQRFEAAPGNVAMMERYGPGFDPESGTGDMQVWLPLAS
ncbi:MAG: GyrI-like domain-containing protein [Chloroflexota bacterium]|nr:GyrI-like domain-containing protein [Chloroflexota bacterium]